MRWEIGEDEVRQCEVDDLIVGGEQKVDNLLELETHVTTIVSDEILMISIEWCNSKLLRLLQTNCCC